MSQSSTTNRPVLVLDADQASALAIVRSLGRHGVSIEIASAEGAPIASYSRYTTRCHHYPNPLHDESGFLTWIAQIQSETRHALIIPVTERTIVPMARQHDQIDLTRIAMAPIDALDQVLDKSKTLTLAESLGIPSPRSVTIQSLADLDENTPMPDYPVVVKPMRSVGQEGAQRIQLTVSYAHDRTELEAQVRHALRFGEVLLQEYFRGEGVGIELIANHGRVCYAFQHRRLHEVPLTGGGSSLRISEAVAPALLSASEQLIQALGWHGVAMVEFKFAPATGEYRLIEINGRFWGSLPLAIAAGADFPAMLLDLYTKGDIGNVPPARIGTICRNLRRDLDWLEHVVRKAAPPRMVRLPSTTEVLRDLLLVFSPRHRFDVQSLDDLKPGIIDIGQITRHYWQRIVSALRERRRRQQELQTARSAGRKVMSSAQKVLFLCYGNINRSALAQAYAATRKVNRLGLDSAGFHTPGGRPADQVMVEVAGRHGVDLQHWQSRVLTTASVDDADIILAMESVHLDRLIDQFPAARSKSFLLAAMSADNPAEIEISDPYGKDPVFYEEVCERIMHSVDSWLEAQGATPPEKGSRLATKE